MTNRRTVLIGALGAVLAAVALAALLHGRLKEEVMAAEVSTLHGVLPAIDRAAPAKTERAVFALG